MRELLNSSNGLEQKNEPDLVVHSEHGQYAVNRLIAATKAVRYYLCQDQNQDWRILSIAATAADNPMVETIAEILRDLAAQSAAFESEYHKQNLSRVSYIGFRRDLLYQMRREAASGSRSTDLNRDPTPEELEAIERAKEKILDLRLHYDWLIPMLSESFVCEPQGRRQVNILSFAGIEAGEFMPLAQILQKNQRVDLKTSVWIVGRMLKLLDFTIDAEVGTSFALDKFLLGPREHHLVMLDWTNARKVFGDDREGVNLNILRIGECGLKLIGATYDKTGWQYDYPYVENEVEYIDFLHQMATLSEPFYRSYQDIRRTHRRFYGVVDKVWGRAYHPFTTFPK